MMLDYADPTPIIDPVVRSASVAPFEPGYPTRDAALVQTALASSAAEIIDLFKAVTGPQAPTIAMTGRTVPAVSSASSMGEFSSHSRYATPQGQSEIERIAKDRMRLMAVKYASDSASMEIMARLEILNRRLLNVSPRVSDAQVKALEDAKEDLLRIRSSRENRAMRLGLSS